MTSRSRSRKSKKPKPRGHVHDLSTPMDDVTGPQFIFPEAEKLIPSDVPLGQKRQGLRLSQYIGEIVMPGDEFALTSKEGVVVLGPGLQLKAQSNEDEVDKIAIVNKAGVLVKRKPNTFYIEMASRGVRKR